MANRYWVGGTGPWNTTSTTNWSATTGGASGASVPTSADSVFFDQIGTYTVTLTGALNCLDITTSAGTVTFISGTAPTLTIAGSLSLIAGTVWTTTAVKSFTSSTTSTITTNGVTLSGNIVLNGSGAYSLGSALTIGGTLQPNFGTFNTGNFSMALNGFDTTGGTSTVNLGSSTITIFSISLAAATTLNAGTSNITVTGLTIAIAGKTLYNLAITGGFAASSLSGSGTLNNLTITPQTGLTYKPITASGTYTINGTFSAPAPTYTSYRNGITGGSFIVATAGTVSSVDFSGCTFTGAATPIATTECGDLGSNTGLTLQAGRTLYHVAGLHGGTTVPPWSLTSGGTGTVQCGLAQDTCIINNSSPSSWSNNGSQNGYRIGELDATTRTTAHTLTLGPAGSSGTHYGSFQTSSAVTVTQSGGPTITFSLPSYRTGPLLFAAPTSTATSVSLSFLSTLNTSGIRLTNNWAVLGTSTVTMPVDLNGYTLSCVSWSFSGSPTITWNNGTIVCTGTPFTVPATANFVGTGNVTMNSATAKTFNGGGKTYGTITQTGAGSLSITGSNTFETIVNTVQPTTILFTAGTTTTVRNWLLRGTAGNLVTIGSTTAATHTLSRPNGAPVSTNYLSISQSIATGAAWYAGANSTDGGTNTGWIFAAAPPMQIDAAMSLGSGLTFSY